MTIDTQKLSAADGLLLLLTRHLDKLQPKEVLEIVSDDPASIHDLPSWTRLAGHRYISGRQQDGRFTHTIEKGSTLRILTKSDLDWGSYATVNESRFDTKDWLIGRAAHIEETARNSDGFTPRGAVVEEGSPNFDFDVLRRDEAWSESAADFYEQATAGHWDGSRDIPWSKLLPLDDELERAVCQLMTFLAENEFSALYVPAKWIARIHPHFTETVLFLSTQVRDEARHIEVFVKRALSNGGGLQFSSASTQASLKSLLDQENFIQASFLLSVLGEGTFLDLLRYVETHAPEPVTREIARRTRLDETRHVHFALDHIRQVLRRDPSLRAGLRSAILNRAAILAGVKGLNPLVDESLAILAAGGLRPESITKGIQARANLYSTMHENRIRRLETIGFSGRESEELSQLHTPNFM